MTCYCFPPSEDPYKLRKDSRLLTCRKGRVRNGFGAIRIHFDIRANASEDDVKALVAQSQKRSAVFDVITNPTYMI
jgi:hypothetical protein